MVHAAIYWPCDNSDSICQWAFALTHAAWLYNHLPNRHLGWQSPLEVFTKTKSDHRALLRTHVWGCPAFVLEAKLQDGHKIPKFNRRARMGQFLGFSDEHSSLVAQVRNLSTNYVSPQFHVVFDDLFTSIYNDTRLEDTELESIFENLFTNCRDFYGEQSLAPEGASASSQGEPEVTVHSPELSDEWLSEPEIMEKKNRIEMQRLEQHKAREKQAKDFERWNADFNPPYPIPEPLIGDETPDWKFSV